jgi:alkylation response protein AidB-like acyl-CoA dehydrogenase
MTEPEVASSDATNICTRIERQGDEYVINGHKWWISGAGDPRCQVFITMGKTDPEAAKHSQQSMIIIPADAKGIRIARPLNVMGYDDAPTAIWRCISRTCAFPSATSCWAKGAASRSPRAASARAASTTACA